MSTEPSEVTDEELAAVVARIRSHRFRERRAKLAGAGVAFLGIVLGCGADWMLSAARHGEPDASTLRIVLVVSVSVGAAVYKWLEPKEHPGDLEG